MKNGEEEEEVVEDEGEDTDKNTDATINKPRPPKPRPLQSMGPIGTDTQSWIRPTTSGHEAPNGKSVL